MHHGMGDLLVVAVRDQVGQQVELVAVVRLVRVAPEGGRRTARRRTRRAIAGHRCAGSTCCVSPVTMHARFTFARCSGAAGEIARRFCFVPVRGTNWFRLGGTGGFDALWHAVEQ